jgi:hypothetical protein
MNKAISEANGYKAEHYNKDRGWDFPINKNQWLRLVDNAQKLMGDYQLIQEHKNPTPAQTPAPKYDKDEAFAKSQAFNRAARAARARETSAAPTPSPSPTPSPKDPLSEDFDDQNDGHWGPAKKPLPPSLRVDQ